MFAAAALVIVGLVELVTWAALANPVDEEAVESEVDEAAAAEFSVTMMVEPLVIAIVGGDDALRPAKPTRLLSKSKTE